VLYKTSAAIALHINIPIFGTNTFDLNLSILSGYLSFEVIKAKSLKQKNTSPAVVDIDIFQTAV